MVLFSKTIEIMTLQDLKNNRNEIISIIIEGFGNDNLVSVMNLLKAEIEWFQPDGTINEILDNMDENGDFDTLNSKPDNSLASKMANYHENERYNHLNKTWGAQ